MFMNYQSFRTTLAGYPLFTSGDVAALDEKVYYHRLVEWQKKGYIRRMAKNIFTFSENRPDEWMLFLVANKLYTPSCVSLESALSLHGLIPETTFAITSVSTKKTTRFESVSGLYIYRKIKPALMFGYDLKHYRNTAIRIATPEKALLDFLYLNPGLEDQGKLEELRINSDGFAGMNFKKINTWLEYIDSPTLTQRFRNLERIF